MAVEAISEEQEKQAEAVQAANDKLEEQKKTADDTLMQQAAADKLAEVNLVLSTLPDKIEETIVLIREKLDTLLGKINDPTTDPDSPEFDINAVVKPLMNTIVTPLTTAIAPLTVVAGKIPGLSDLGNITSTVSKESEPKVLTKEEIQDKSPETPEMPSSLGKELVKIGDNMLAICMLLLLMLINLIFAMIDVIYSKLKIITSVIPLGNFFPLNLLPSAKAAVPKVKDFVTNAPSEVKKMVEGVARQKMAESSVLGVPDSPSVDSMKSAASSAASSATSGTVPTLLKDDAQVIKEADEAKSNTENSPPPAPPVESSVKEVKPNPPTPAPLKTYEEVVEYWKSKFSEIQLIGLEENVKFNNGNYSDELNYAYYVNLDDPWSCMARSVEFDSLKNPKKAMFDFQEAYRNIANIDGYGYWAVQMTNYSMYELEKSSDGKLNIVQKRYNKTGRYLFCTKEYLDEWRIVKGNDKYNEWLEDIKTSKKYTNSAGSDQKEQIDKGIEKVSMMLDKYCFFDKSLMPQATLLMFMGRNKVF